MIRSGWRCCRRSFGRINGRFGWKRYQCWIQRPHSRQFRHFVASRHFCHGKIIGDQVTVAAVTAALVDYEVQVFETELDADAEKALRKALKH